MEMLLQGLMLGLSISLLMGPIIFLFFEASANNGKMGGFMIGLGAWISDLTYLLFSYFAYKSITTILNQKGFEFQFGLVGGCLLLLLGVITYLNAGKRKNVPRKTNLMDKKSNLENIIKGFLVNTINPFCAALWIGAVSSIMIQGTIPFGAFILFCLGSIGAIVITDLIKILAAKKLIVYLSEKRIKVIRRIAGMGIFIFGLILIIRVVQS